MKLDMGGGDYPREGFINVDPYTENADIHADMGDLPLDDNTVDEIWSCHALEHVSKFQVVPILQEWKRIIKPGGLITIEVPSLDWICKNWLWRRTNDWHMDTIFGMQNKPGEEHRTGFTPEIMQSYLNEAGLTTKRFAIVQSHGQDTLHFEITK
jgi:predicted SAM-dependent methyltransferase